MGNPQEEIKKILSIKSWRIETSHYWCVSIRVASPAFVLGRQAFMPDGVSINGTFEAERPPALARPPLGGWAATFDPYVWHKTLLSSLSHNPAYIPRPRFGSMKLLASLVGQWPAGFKSQHVLNLPLPFIPTLIGLRAFDLVSSPVWWEAVTNISVTRDLSWFKWFVTRMKERNSKCKSCYNKVLSILMQFFQSVFISEYFFLIPPPAFLSFCYKI